jgi:hypothetical protein
VAGGAGEGGVLQAQSGAPRIPGRGARGDVRARYLADERGRAVQVDATKPTLKAPGTKRLKLKCGKPLSRFAFKVNLRRYSMGWAVVASVVYGAFFGARCGWLQHEGRGLHSFPFPLNLSLICRSPLKSSSLCPPYNPNAPVDVARRRSR